MKTNFSGSVTAEQVTRHLRDRKADLIELIPFANSLLSGELNVYLPQKESFVLEWWFDRMGEAKNSHCRTNKDFWHLFTKTWKALESDREVCSRLFRYAKFYEILLKSLEDFRHENSKDGSKVKEYLSSVLEAVNTLCASGIVLRTNSTDFATTLMGEFLQLSLALIESGDFEEQALNVWVTRFQQIFKSSLYGLTDSKKLLNSFNTKCIHLIFTLLGTRNTPEFYSEFIKDLLISVTFRKESADDSSEAVEKLIKLDTVQNIDNTIISEAIPKIYTIALESSSKISTEIHQKLFDIFNKSYPGCTEELLNIALKHNAKVISTSLVDIMNRELSKETPNWKLLSFVVRLDFDVVLQDFSPIFSKLEKNDEDTLLMARCLVTGYSQARDLNKFFETWSESIGNGENIWCNTELLEAVANSVSTLSAFQVSSILTSLLDKLDLSLEKQRQPKKRRMDDKQTFVNILLPIESLLLGIIRSTSMAIINNPKLISDLTRVLKLPIGEDNHLLWKLRYLIFTVNRGILDSNYEDIIKNSGNGEILSIAGENYSTELLVNYAQTIFRIREFHEISEWDSVIVNILRSLEINKSHTTESLKIFAYRWLVLANNLFSRSCLRQLSDMFINDAEAMNTLLSVDEFFEQVSLKDNVIFSLINYVKDEVKINYALDTLVRFPIECFKKNARHDLLVALIEAEGQTRELENLLKIRNLIKFILEGPTHFPELDLISVFSVLKKTRNSALIPVTIAIGDLTLKNFKELGQASKFSAFAESLIKVLSKKLAKVADQKEERFPWELKLSLLIFSRILEVDNKTFRDIVVERLTGYLTDKLAKLTSNSNDEILLEAVTTIIEDSHVIIKLLESGLEDSNLLNIIEQMLAFSISYIYTNKDSPALPFYTLLASRLYMVRGRSMTTLSSSRLSLAIFMTLNSQIQDSVISKTLEFSLSKLSSDDFYTIFLEICELSKDSPEYYDTLEVFAATFNHENHSKMDLLISKIISSFSSNMKKIKDPRTVTKFLTFANALLKEKSWMISQYILESLIALATKIASPLGPVFNEAQASQENIDTLYAELTHIISSILLFHRHRINGRHHLIIKVFISLVSCLAKRKVTNSKTYRDSDRLQQIPWLSTPCSVKSALNYSRLLSNLCEPPVQAVREKGGSNSLISSSAQAKRALSKHLMPLLLAYVYYGLHYTFVADIRDVLSSGFYVLFDIMSSDQFKIASAAMDGSSRVYFKTLYDDYKKHGKWSDE